MTPPPPSRGVAGLAQRVMTSLRSRRRGSPASAGGSETPNHRKTSNRRGTGGIVVDYRPDADGGADPGEVVWTWVPFEEDRTQGKDRPILVVGAIDDRLAAVMLTSKPHPERTDQVEVGSGPWDREGRTSYAKLDRLVAVQPDRIRREGSALDRQRFDRVVAELSARPGWPHLNVDPI